MKKQSHKSKYICKPHKPTHKPKFASLLFSIVDKIGLKKFPTLQKNKKRNAQPTLNDTETQY